MLLHLYFRSTTSSFDLEFLFMNLRARSVEEVVELKYKCNNEVKDEEGHLGKCNGSVAFKLNILEVEPSINPEHTNKIYVARNYPKHLNSKGSFLIFYKNQTVLMDLL